MALYHLSVKPVSRGSGRSAVATAAYRVAEELHDARQGVTHDYTRKQGVDARLLLMADGTGALLTMEGAGWTAERERLWNAAEAAEKRKDARVAREYEVALPCELDRDGRRALVAAFGRELVERYGVAVDAAIHAPGREGDARNWHAHVLATTRQATPTGLGEKAAIELSDSARAKQGLGPGAAEVEALRALWAVQVNHALERIQAEARVDHRSYARQGREELTPEQHAGPAVSGMERKAEVRRRRAQVQARAEPGRERAAEAPGRARAGVEAAAAAAGPEMARAAPERPQGGLGGPQEAARAVLAPAGVSGPVQGRQTTQHGLGRAREGATGQDAVRPVSSTGPGLDRPARGAAGMYGSGAEPVTRVGQRNAEIQARNRTVETARKAVEQAQRVLRELERAARRVLGLARGLGAQVVEAQRAREREAERQRQERERVEMERRAELERAQQAAELRQRQEAERPALTQAQRDAARQRPRDFTPEQAAREAEASRRQAAERASRRSRGPSLGM